MKSIEDDLGRVDERSLLISSGVTGGCEEREREREKEKKKEIDK